jgi:hypothetical protein
MSRTLLQQAFIALRSAGRGDGNYHDYNDVADALEAELAKPEQDRVSHLRCDFLDHINGAICEMGQTYDRKNLRLVFDGETGKLKSAEVI